MNDFFVRHKKFAILGLSRDPKSFSRQAYSYFKSQGYEMYPVNPNVELIDDQACYQSIESLPDVKAAVFFAPTRYGGIAANLQRKGHHRCLVSTGFSGQYGAKCCGRTGPGL